MELVQAIQVQGGWGAVLMYDNNKKKYLAIIRAQQIT